MIIELKLEDEVQILGAIQHHEVFDFLEKLDVYIHPSLTEGMPRALIEAMSVGCPAMGSDTGGIPELLSKECLFQPGDVEQIVSRISNLNSEKMIQMARTNFEKAAEFEQVVLNERRLNFYKEFLSENGFE